MKMVITLSSLCLVFGSIAGCHPGIEQRSGTFSAGSFTHGNQTVVHAHLGGRALFVLQFHGGAGSSTRSSCNVLKGSGSLSGTVKLHDGGRLPISASVQNGALRSLQIGGREIERHKGTDVQYFQGGEIKQGPITRVRLEKIDGLMEVVREQESDHALDPAGQRNDDKTRSSE